MELPEEDSQNKEKAPETPEPSLVLSFDDVLKAYNSLQEAGKLKGTRRRKSTRQSDAYSGKLSKEPGIRYETHSYFHAEYRDPHPAHASERNPNQIAHISLFLTSNELEQVHQASRIYSVLSENFGPITLILHDHLATTVCYRSNKCRLFQPELARSDEWD